MPTRSALLIGVRRYEDERLTQLGAPAADVKALARVLLDPAIAAFDTVKILIDPARQRAIDAIADLIHDRSTDDLVLLYFSGHGIRDDRGELFLALGATRWNLPRPKSLPATEVRAYLDDSKSRRQVLILDCCHAGAFMKGAREAVGAPAVTADLFQVKGYAREILCATNVTGYAFEATRARGDGTARQLGHYTHFLVEGLQTGEAGGYREFVTAVDLHDYASKCLLQAEPRMRPQHWRDYGEAALVIARNPRAAAIKKSVLLDAELQAALFDKNPRMRIGAVVDLQDLSGGEGRVALEARRLLEAREPQEKHPLVRASILLALNRPPEVQARRTTLVGPAPGTVFRDVDELWCPELVVVAAGRFRMGSPNHEPGRFPNEGPEHEVVFAQPFALGRFPVTFNEFDVFCDATTFPYPGNGGWHRGRRPVINVSWEGAQAYLRWLRERTNEPYRLPSEAEWEYGCRAGTNTPFWTGSTITTEHANYNGKYVYGAGMVGEDRKRTTDVDAFAANAWGLHDMHGNVWEWTQDCYKGSYDGVPADGSSYFAAHCKSRVLRGGSWLGEPALARSAVRFRHEPWIELSYLGFRVARTLAPSAFASLPPGVRIKGQREIQRP